MRRNDVAVMKAVVICYKPFLKPEEAMLYCDLEHSQLAKRVKEWGIIKSTTGYYKRDDLDRMMGGINELAGRVDHLKP